MKKGFTLIELLVVIAIIGILASIVLVALGSARNKAKDSAIKADLAQVRNIAELWANDYNYLYDAAPDGGGDSLCVSSTNLAKIQADVLNKGGTSWVCNDLPLVWCVSAVTPSVGTIWCVDSAGSVGSGATACDATNANCAMP